MNKYIWTVWDLDGTLSDHSARLQYAVEKDWHEYHSRLSLDPPRRAECTLLRSFYHAAPGHRVCILTARPVRYRDETVDWINGNNIPWDSLIMRPDKDWRKSEVFKEDVYISNFKNRGTRVIFAFDDRDSVVEMWWRNGIVCFKSEEMN